MSANDELAFESILMSHDDPVHVESPDANDEEDLRQFRLLAYDLIQQISLESRIEDGELIQDATFLGEIRFNASPNDVIDENDYFIVRVSRWGRLAAVWNESVAGLLPMEKIKDELSNHGYIYIPERFLRRPYDGGNIIFQGLDWWDRYFEWY